MAGPALSVLLVEDETLIAMDAEDMLRDCGVAEVVLATDYETAAAALDARVFDLVVFDLDLSGVSSLPLIEARAAAGVPTVVTSGYDDPPAALAALGVPVLRKPLSLRHLKEGAEAAGTRLPC